jgi:tRNA(fMet)-specific endonuclease VapC
MRYLLDTNTCIAAMRHHATVLQRLAAVAPTNCAISSITTYELYTGIEKCADPTKERAKVHLLLATVSELVFDGRPRAKPGGFAPGSNPRAA